MFQLFFCNTNRFSRLFALALLVSCFFRLDAQDYIKASGLHGSSLIDNAKGYSVFDDRLYVFGRTTGSNFPTTDGSSTNGGMDYFFLKYEADSLNLLKATIVGGISHDFLEDIKTDSSYFYLAGDSWGPGMPSTSGAGYAGNTDVHLMKLDLEGNVIGGVYLGGSEGDYFRDFIIHNGKAFILINVTSTDFPTTDGSVLQGNEDIGYVQIDLNTMTIDYATLLGGNGKDYSGRLAADGNTVYVGFRSNSMNLPVTDSTFVSGSIKLVVAALDINTHNLIAMTSIGGSLTCTFSDIIAEGGNVFVQGSTSSQDFKITNNSFRQFNNNAVLVHYDANLNLQLSTYVSVVGGTSRGLEYHGGYLYLTTRETFLNQDLVVLKLDLNGNIIWSYSGVNDNTGQVDLKVYNDKIHLLASVSSFNSVSTNGSYFHGAKDYYYAVLTLDGNLDFASYYGGVGLDQLDIEYHVKDVLQIEGSKVWIAGRSEDCFPTTNGSSYKLSGDVAVLLIETCPTGFHGDATPVPDTQMVCKNGFVAQIKVDPFIISASTLPSLNICGTIVQQHDVHAKYQWQSAANNNGPWTDIPAATQANYTPFPLSVTTYYRRLAKERNCCGGAVLQTSGIHTIIVGANTSPQVDAGGIYNTCPGTSVTMSAMVNGGTPPYQYAWAEGNSTNILSTTTSLTVNPTMIGSVIYTITVTDAVGCEQVDQTILNTYQALAGTDVKFCEGQPGPIIGGSPIQGLPGVVYSWSPSTGLSCTNCPNPIATPATTTQYTLTLTIPVTSGGTCSTTDQVTVNPIIGPSPNFAGVDTVFCFGSSGLIGNPAEPGFSYTWSPGIYLYQDTVTPAIFNHGNINFPVTNPMKHYLTAQKQGCTWYDDMEVAVIRAKAYRGSLDPLCGPRSVGEGDFTPNINETWQWTKLAGDGTFTGPTNIPVTTVSASISQTSYYKLDVSYNGKTCSDMARTPPCAPGGPGSCNVQIFPVGAIGCPSMDVYSMICLRAYNFSTIPGPFTYSWSPQVGLDTFFGPEVCLTDNVHRTYTVTMTNSIDTTNFCTEIIEVNNPAWTTPNFSVQDTSICLGDSINIGEPNVAGYSYEWVPQTHLDNPFISNPLATVSSTSQYYVSVTDLQSGCTLLDSMTIDVGVSYANAGPDQSSCNAGVITLGLKAKPHTTYSWTPAGANWQNGTNQYSAQPEVLVAITTTFILTATNSISGCSDKDTVRVHAGTPVQAFSLADITYCPSQPSVTLGAGIPYQPGYTYLWSPSGNLNNPYAQTPILSPLPTTATIFTVVARNSSGCTYQATQFVNPTVLSPMVAPSTSICVGETVQIGSSANPTGSGITYNWSPLTGLDDPTSPNPIFNATTTGTTTYTLTVTKNGCSNTASVVVNVNDFPLVILPKTICTGACVKIGVQAVPGASYNWFPVTGLDDPTIANPMACVSTNTVYTLIATGPFGCQTTVQVPVFMHPSPAPQVSIPTSTFCLGTTGNTINPTVSPPGNYSYNWPNNGTLIYPSSPSPEVIPTGLGTTSYDVTVTNSVSGCATVATASISVVDCTPNTLCQNADICLEISLDPNHPLSTIDCDGDGVTNADECRDMTDPLDPCDYIDTSITLPVTADQSGCPPPCTDLTTVVKILPGNISGNSLVQTSIKVSEVNNVDTDGSVISVRMPSDPRLVFVWDIGLTFVALTTVQNADWNYLGDNGTFHTWTYNGPGLIIDGQTSSAFGFYSYYDPQGTDGQTTITATVVPFSGGECNLINNSDSERLVYFQ